MKKSLFFVLLSFLFILTSQAMEKNFLSEEQISAAKNLAKSSIGYEAFRKEKKAEGKASHDYLTIENYDFNYKGENTSFIAAIGFQVSSNWGEIALYPGNVNLQKINYRTGGFSDLGAAALYLANLSFEYVPSTEGHDAYFILEKISAGCEAEGKGYSQACVRYYMNEFIEKHTEVKFVFSDARNPICQHFFPRCGLQSGMPEAFKNVKFDRPFHVPFFWQRQAEK